MKRHIRGYKEDIRFYYNIGGAGAPPKDSDNAVIHQRHRGDACGNRPERPETSSSANNRADNGRTNRVTGTTGIRSGIRKLFCFAKTFTKNASRLRGC